MLYKNVSIFDISENPIIEKSDYADVPPLSLFYKLRMQVKEIPKGRSNYCMAYLCDIISTSGKAVPVGALKWYEDEAVFVIPFKGNPRMGIVLYDISSLLPSTASRQLVTENLISIVSGNIHGTWGNSVQGAVSFSKHPLYLIIIRKYTAELAKATGSSLATVMQALLNDKGSSLVYNYAKFRCNLILDPLGRYNILTSTFTITHESHILSGGVMDDMIQEAYTKTKKAWGKKELPGNGDGYKVESLIVSTACQYSASNNVGFPTGSALSESEFYGRVLTDIMDGTPDSLSVPDPQTISALYNELPSTAVPKDVTAETWEVVKNVMQDFYANKGTVDSSAMQNLISKTGINRLVSVQLCSLIGKVEDSKELTPSAGSAKTIKYLDVMLRLLMTKAMLLK